MLNDIHLLPDDVERAIDDFVVDAGDIKGDKTKRDEYDADEEHIAHAEDGDRSEHIRVDEPVGDEHSREQKSAHCHNDNTDIPCQTEREKRERREAVYREPKKFFV